MLGFHECLVCCFLLWSDANGGGSRRALRCTPRIFLNWNYSMWSWSRWSWLLVWRFFPWILSWVCSPWILSWVCGPWILFSRTSSWWILFWVLGPWILFSRIRSWLSRLLFLSWISYRCPCPTWQLFAWCKGTRLYASSRHRNFSSSFWLDWTNSNSNSLTNIFVCFRIPFTVYQVLKHHFF